jgi:rhodanese-related sulfurtransferase/rubrerythrin
MKADKRAVEIKTMFPDEAKAYMDERKEGTYTLLDVRQPGEYERAHLPGAFLIPLPRLADSLDQLDSSRPTIVYCAVGGRSRVATQLLMHQGFGEVYHIEGGIEAWEGRTASGPREFHFEFIRGDESPEEVIGLAYRMEEGLKRFHGFVKDRTKDVDLSKLLSHLISAEESHERALIELLETLSRPTSAEAAAGLASSSPGGDLLEGGIDVDAFIEQNKPFLQSVGGYLELAMMIETQALDLYLRMAAESRNEVTKSVLLRIGDEEKAHLGLLGRYMDERLQKRGETH